MYPLELVDEDEAVPIKNVEALQGILEDASPIVIVARVLGTLDPERGFVESTPDRGGRGRFEFHSDR